MFRPFKPLLVPVSSTCLCSQVLPLQNDVDEKDWVKKVLGHPNELCRNPQLQIGIVEHLHRHLEACNDFWADSLTFGPDVECFPFSNMCDNRDSSQHISKDCPPLSRLLKSDFFCKNPANFKRKKICRRTNMAQCSGNSQSNCYMAHTQCTAFEDGKKPFLSCSDNSDYICPKALPELNKPQMEDLRRDHLVRDSFKGCKEKGHFVCDDQMKCIHKTLLCDGYEQCDDGSDEERERCIKCP